MIGGKVTEHSKIVKGGVVSGAEQWHGANPSGERKWKFQMIARIDWEAKPGSWQIVKWVPIKSGDV